MTERQHGGWGPPIREFKNAHGGEVTLTAEDRESVRIEVVWPYDLSRDDWIHIVATFSMGLYAEALACLRRTGRGTVRGERGEQLVLTAPAPGVTGLAVCNEGAATTLHVTLAVSPEDLLSPNSLSWDALPAGQGPRQTPS
jgi:hypothetical protein